ncbi:hypothetical protein H1P_3330006 [Hyella patelloides LEGE 07179]|uniref:Uncharacterized protein n=1 Tax=Hyella patelloides LEGE 07179 TaxID=945734 RepID=A0A563VVJ4_9CYAN|nr:hypothetical protein H1P_3330006 [Hyella patelloides LEGE 07179]
MLSSTATSSSEIREKLSLTNSDLKSQVKKQSLDKVKEESNNYLLKKTAKDVRVSTRLRSNWR